MNTEDLSLQWVEEEVPLHHEEVICGLEEELVHEGDVIGACEEVCMEEVVHEETIVHTTDNLESNDMILMSQATDMESIYIVPQDPGHDYLNIQEVTEEVITDNWNASGGDDGVDMPETKVSHDILLEYDDMEVPLPTDQDTSTRPYPCDYCSRRFTKEANLMNHMSQHQTDRVSYPCHFCGERFQRKTDLINHKKTHALDPSELNFPDDDFLYNDTIKQRRKKPQTTSRKRKYTAKTSSPKRNYQSTSNKNTDLKYGKNYDYNFDDMINKYSTQSIGPSSSRWPDDLAPEQPPRFPITDATKPYVCQTCGVGFQREKALASHSRCHGGDSPSECTNCGDVFWDTKSLKEHIRIKHGINEEDDDDNIDNDDLNNYSTIHDDLNINNDQYNQHVCEICGVMFERYNDLKRHRKSHVKQELLNDVLDTSLHACSTCGDTFDNPLSLLAHAERHAVRSSPIRNCLLCGTECRDDNEVADHVRNCHPDSPNICKQCGKQCKDKRSLIKHTTVHDDNKIFGCTECDKKFHSKARLRRHMQSHKNKTVRCQECGENFENGRALISHKHSHKQSGGKIFPCDTCGKTFGSRSSQQIHVRIHTGERPYECHYCWKKFADGGTLRKHERIHTGEKPYVCAVCPARAFNQRVVLREHVRAHHSQQDPKYIGTLTPYYCKVCNNTFATSDDVIQHIIGHCDANTALKRQPQTGPRKYKRRRKTIAGTSGVGVGSSNNNNHHNSNNKLTDIQLSPKYNNDNNKYNINNNNNNNFHNNDGGTSDSEDNTKRKLGKKNKQRLKDCDNLLKSCENSLQNIGEIVTKTSGKLKYKKTKLKNNNIDNNSSDCKKINNTLKLMNQQQSGRPKMIHTQKTRVPVDISNDVGIKKGQKTKTMVTKTPRVLPLEHKSGLFPGGERNRPRTKNVSYHVDGKLQIVPATFGKSNNETKTNILTSTRVSSIKSSVPSAASVVSPFEHVQVKMEQHDVSTRNVSTRHVSTRRSTAAAAAAAAAASSSSSTSTTNHLNNNENIKVETKKKAGRKSRKNAKTIIKQEPIDDLNNIDVDDHLARLGCSNDDNLNSHDVDGNLNVGFNTNVGLGRVKQRHEEYDDDDDVDDNERILPDIHNVNHTEEIPVTPQRLLRSMHIPNDDDVVAETIVPETVDYRCDMCGDIFTSHNELSAHVLIHI